MSDTIKTGTILIKEGTLLPEAARFESKCSVPAGGAAQLSQQDRGSLPLRFGHAFRVPGASAGQVRGRAKSAG